MRRPSLFTFAALSLAGGFLAGGAWLVSTPRPLAGEPVVVAAIPPVAELQTASTDPAVDEGQAVEETDLEEVIDQSAAEIQVFDGEAREEAEYQQEATVFIAPSRPLQRAPIADVTETTRSRPAPPHFQPRPQALRSLFSSDPPLGHQFEAAEDRHRAGWHGAQRQADDRKR